MHIHILHKCKHTNTLFYTFLYFFIYHEDYLRSHTKSCFILLVATQYAILGLSRIDGYLKVSNIFYYKQRYDEHLSFCNVMVCVYNEYLCKNDGPMYLEF